MPFPLMPTDSSQIASPSGPSGLSSAQSPGMGGPTGGPGGLMSMLGMQGAPPASGSDASQMAGAMAQGMQQIDFIQQKVDELTRAYPGNEQASQQIVDGLNLFKQGLVTSMSVPSPMMPGAAQML